MAFAQGLGGGGGAEVPTGAIVMWGNAAAPVDWLLCDGSAVNRVTYADLFAVVGVTFGPGDGVTTFNVPDFRQRFPLGKAAAGTGSTLGGTGGLIDHVHTGPVHGHGVTGITVQSWGAHTHGAGTLTDGVINLAHTHGPGTLTTGGPSASVNRGSGTTAVATGSHGHAVTAGLTGSGLGGHNHGVTGTTASDGTHGHNLTGSADNGGGGNTGTANPPFLAVNFIIRT